MLIYLKNMKAVSNIKEKKDYCSSPTPSNEGQGECQTEQDQHRKSSLKRRRKILKPGLTATKKERYFVQHDYHDHADDEENDFAVGTFDLYSHTAPGCDTGEGGKFDFHSSAGPSLSFPFKLHTMLANTDRDGYSLIVSWQPHGRCFMLRDVKAFTNTVLPRYFNLSKITSFQRQLNLYGFRRLTHGADAGAYYHELFLRGKLFLCHRIQRMKNKGVGYKAASSPETEPNFYLMKPLPETPIKQDFNVMNEPEVSEKEGPEKNSERDYLAQLFSASAETGSGSANQASPVIDELRASAPVAFVDILAPEQGIAKSSSDVSLPDLIQNAASSTSVSTITTPSLLINRSANFFSGKSKSTSGSQVVFNHQQEAAQHKESRRMRSHSTGQSNFGFQDETLLFGGKIITYPPRASSVPCEDKTNLGSPFLEIFDERLVQTNIQDDIANERTNLKVAMERSLIQPHTHDSLQDRTLAAVQIHASALNETPQKLYQEWGLRPTNVDAGKGFGMLGRNMKASEGNKAYRDVFCEKLIGTNFIADYGDIRTRVDTRDANIAKFNQGAAVSEAESILSKTYANNFLKGDVVESEFQHMRLGSKFHNQDFLETFKWDPNVEEALEAIEHYPSVNEPRVNESLQLSESLGSLDNHATNIHMLTTHPSQMQFEEQHSSVQTSSNSDAAIKMLLETMSHD